MVSLTDKSACRNDHLAAEASWLPGWQRLRNVTKWWSNGHPVRPWLEHYPDGVPPQLAYPEQRLCWLLHQAAERFPRRIACHYYREQVTYEELLARAQGLAATFVREGLKPGDRVGVLLPNLPETLVALFATWMAGGVVVSLSPLMVVDEVEGLINATGCRCIVTLDVLTLLVCQGKTRPDLVVISSLAGRLSRLEQVGYAWMRFQRLGFGTICPQTRVLSFDDATKGGRNVDGGSMIDGGGIHDPAFVLPTGGTTGKPKAVTLSHGNLIAQAWQLSHWSRGHHGEETILAVLPYPGVKDVAVVGVPDEQKGEVVSAVLVVDSPPGFRRRDFDEFTRQKLAAYKRPKIVEVREEDLPRNFLGKVLRRELRQQHAS